MNSGQFIYLLSSWIIYLFLWISSIYGLHAIYYTYFKSKDERQKYIVLRSTTHAFGILLLFFFVYYIIQMIVTVADIKQLTLLWSLLHFGIESSNFSIAMVSAMMGVLGVCLFINKQKVGGD